MKCTRCGQENAHQAQFCQGCGAALQKPTQVPDAVQSMSNKRILGAVWVIAGMLLLVGIFTPWVAVSGWGVSASASAWDSVTNAEVMGGEVGREGWAFVALLGAILTLAGSLSALASPKTRVFWGILGIGGVFAVIGAVWGFSDIETGSALGISVGYGAGLYLTLVGGILGLVGGSLGLWFCAKGEKTSS